MEFPALTETDFSVWTTVQKFSEIEILPNTLVLCDIDDTLLHHPAINNYWVKIVNTFFYMKIHALTGEYDTKQSNEETNRYVDEVFARVPIQHTDRDGFFKMVERSSDFAFVTARYEEARGFTYDNLRGLDIDPNVYKVYFCGHIPKGEYIKRTFDLTKYEHVIFIDDQTRNLENVFLVVSHPGLKLYRFKHERSENIKCYYPLPHGFNPQLWFDGTYLRNNDTDDIV